MRITLTGLQWLSAQWLFPGLVVATVVGSQLWMHDLVIVQTIGWVNGLAAAMIVMTLFRHKSWLLLWVICIVLAKIGASGSPPAEVTYLILLNLLYCSAGAVTVFKYSNLVYKQVMIICLLNTIFMIMQVVGVGEWTQFLTTHGTTSWGMHSKEPEHVLFVQAEELVFNTIQGRPAGLSHSNIMVSLIALFGLALHLSRGRDRFAWGTLMLCAMMVLAMAKVLFLGFVLVALLLLISGNDRQRLGILIALGLTVIFLALYAVVFPGLFAHNFSPFIIGFSFLVRMNDIAETFAQGSILQMKLEQYLSQLLHYLQSLEYVPEGLETFDLQDAKERISGLTTLLEVLPYVVGLLFIAVPPFLRGFHRLRSWSPHLAGATLSTLMVVLIFPSAFPIWPLSLYWFMAGFAFLPLYLLLRPHYFKISLATASGSPGRSAEVLSPVGEKTA